MGKLATEQAIAENGDKIVIVDDNIQSTSAAINIGLDLAL